jgi:hypothetical protein
LNHCPLIYTSQVAWDDRCVSQKSAVGWHMVSRTFCPDWPQIAILLNSASQVARIISVRHCTWPQRSDFDLVNTKGGRNWPCTGLAKLWKFREHWTINWNKYTVNIIWEENVPLYLQNTKRLCTLPWFCCCLNFVLFCFVATRSHYVAQTGLPILLSQPPECWDYRCESPHLADFFLHRIIPRKWKWAEINMTGCPLARCLY